MNEYLQENRRSLLLLVGLMLILILAIYIFLVRPIMVDYKSEVQQIDELDTEISSLEKEISKEENLSDEVDVEQLVLENRIPTKKDLDEFVLYLQQLELHTNSKIEEIEVSYDESLQFVDEESSEGEELEEDVSEDDEELDEDYEDDLDEQEEVNSNLLNEKPDELQMINIRLTAFSPNFDELIELLNLIENEERISILTGLEFNIPSEEDLYFSNNPEETISFTANITTFYYEQAEIDS